MLTYMIHLKSLPSSCSYSLLHMWCIHLFTNLIWELETFLFTYWLTKFCRIRILMYCIKYSIEMIYNQTHVILQTKLSIFYWRKTRKKGNSVIRLFMILDFYGVCKAWAFSGFLMRCKSWSWTLRADMTRNFAIFTIF